MVINIHIVTLLSLIVSVQGIFLSLFLLQRNTGNTKANRILTVLILLFILRFLETSAYWSDFFLYHPHFVFITNSFPFLFGLLLFFYARFLLTNEQKFHKKDLLHFIPFIVFFIYLIRFYLRSAEYKLGFINTQIQSSQPEFPLFFFILRFIQYIHMLVYTLLTIKLVTAYNKKLINDNAEHFNTKIQWLKNLSILFIAFILLYFIEIIQLYFFKAELMLIIDTAIVFIFILFIYAVGYYAIKQPPIAIETLLEKPFVRYVSSSLTAEKIEKISQDVLHLFQSNKPHLKNDIRIADVAKSLSISTHQLSQVINTKFQLSFVDFINSYRVEEARRMLLDKKFDNLTILTIAYESGFKNKSSFNNAFKKFTGFTPSEFKQTESNSD